jgi:DNA gyrase/topoisomerase IV subunit B
MYVGASEPGRPAAARLLEGLVDAIAHDTPRPQEIRVQLWSGSVITVAYDGAPLPIEPFVSGTAGVSHPALYYLFMHLYAGGAPFDRFLFGAILNALSERLVVSTMRDSDRYRVVFAKGNVVRLLHRTSCPRPLGVTWFTFRPDIAIIGGDQLTLADVERIAERQGSPRVFVEDHSGEETDWN